jgi:nicotinamidase-related amidase
MSKRTLLVVDVLAGIFELGVELHDADGFLERTESLIASARKAGVPVVYIQHEGPTGSPFEVGTPGWHIHARVAPESGDPVVSKREPDSFQDSKLDQVLDELGVHELVVCGFATEGCIDSTVRSAYGRGYTVTLVSDCHTTTANAVLPAEKIVTHHNFVLARFATVAPSNKLSFAA